LDKEQKAREESGKRFNRAIARQSSLLCEFLQDAKFSPAEKQAFIKFLVKEAIK